MYLKIKKPLPTWGLIATFAVFGTTGCGSNNRSYDSGSVAPQPASLGFTQWSKQFVYAQTDASTPIETEMLSFNFDGDEDPNAYLDLLPPT